MCDAECDVIEGNSLTHLGDDLLVSQVPRFSQEDKPTFQAASKWGKQFPIKWVNCERMKLQNGAEEF